MEVVLFECMFLDLIAHRLVLGPQRYCLANRPWKSCVPSRYRRRIYGHSSFFRELAMR